MKIKINKKLTESTDPLIDQGVEVLAYADTDVIYYCDANPELTASQAEAFGPLWAWIESEYGARIVPLTGLAHGQSPAIRQAAADVWAELRDEEKPLFARIVRSLSSFWLAAAVRAGFLSVERAFHCARLEEQFQAAKWGEDEDTASASKSLWDDVRNTADLLNKMRGK